MKRMDRYNDEIEEELYSRSNKNQELYRTIGSNTKITNFSDVEKSNVYDINPTNNTNTREGYRTRKEYDSSIKYAPKEKRELENFNKLYKKDEHKVYDINSVLENARAKKEKDELDSKRNLKNANYNILENYDEKDINKYRKEKQDRIKSDQEAELKNIIDKTMNGEIDQETTINLLSDLMATSAMDAIEAPEKDEVEEEQDLDPVDRLIIKAEKEEITIPEEKEEIKEEIDKEEYFNNIEEESKKDNNKEKKKGALANADNDFYTGSMELSTNDFMADLREEKSLPTIVKILIFILVLAIAAAIAYFIYQNM